jgi:hypothetical protein
MRTVAIAAAVLLASASAALAQPASVTVTVGPALQAKAERSLGVRDVDGLAADLRKAVEVRLARTHAYDGARIELVLADAKPNRPTFQQLGDTPGLSYQSFGLGGARIEGRVVAPDGTVTPVAYKDYETDIRQSRHGGTWTDAETAIDRFAHNLSRGERLAQR